MVTPRENEDEPKTTELAPIFGTNLVEIGEGTALMKAMEETAEEGGRGGDFSFMSFSGKWGLYKIGVDGRSPGEKEPFLVAVPSFELGWVCWKGGKPVSKRLAKITSPQVQQPDPEEMGPFNENQGEGWQRARSITVRSLENDEQCYFSNNSKSGVAGMSDLQREVLERMKTGQPCWPIITFGMEEFTAQGQTNFKPTFNIVEWADTEQVQALSDPDVDPMSLLGETEVKEEEETPAPKKRRRL